MKRLFLRDAARGTDAGHGLAEASMAAARALGFEGVSAYHRDPVLGAVYFWAALR